MGGWALCVWVLLGWLDAVVLLGAVWVLLAWLGVVRVLPGALGAADGQQNWAWGCGA